MIRTWKQKLDARTSLANSEEGFTLIEIVIVVVTIGILAAIVTPVFNRNRQDAIEASVKSDVRQTTQNVFRHLSQFPAAANLANHTELFNPDGPPITVSGKNIVAVSGSWLGWGVIGKVADRTWGCEFRSQTGKTVCGPQAAI
jgi:prepilin-type N-terminal cleavage/methylation domain-containing protein